MTLRHLSVSSVSALAFAALAAGCSSSTGSAVPSYGNTATSTPVPTAPVTFTVTPGTGASPSARGRTPKYLSPATQSVSIVPVVTGAPAQQATVIDIGAGVTGCTGSGASLACTGTVTAPVGETSFTVTTYAGTNAQGSVLSVGTITVDVTPAAKTTTISNATSLTLSGVPASFSIAANPDKLTIGTATTVTAVVTVRDATGAIIVGPGSFTTGIDIETITPYGNDSVLTTTNGFVGLVPGCTYPTTPNVTSCHLVSSVLAPSSGVPLSYAGEFVSGTSILLALESPGLKTATTPVALETPGPNSGCTGSVIMVCPGQVTFPNAAASPVPLTVTEAGVSTFTATDFGCVGGGVASVNFQKQTSGDAFTVYPGNTAGTCVAAFSDASGNTTNLNITLLSAATPTPVPSMTPTPVSSGTPMPGPVTISPSQTIDFASSTAPPQTITASEAGFSSFTIVQTGCSGVATVAPTTGTSFTITPVGSLTQGGTCTFAVDDATGQGSDVEVLVNGTTIIINSRKR